MYTQLSRPMCASITFALLVCCSSNVDAQCTCTAEQIFGSCPVEIIGENFPIGSYPDQYPGSVVVARVSANETVAYVADLFSGNTHRFGFDAVLNRIGLKDTIPSPGGSRPTTGITLRTNADGIATDIFWAVDGALMRTNPDGSSAGEVARLDSALDDLARVLREDLADESIQAGRLGDIAYHPTRETFWGVDIVNDAYFEFDQAGQLRFDEGVASYFLNPERSPLTGGAYGNAISLSIVGDEAFFDIPVGSLSDRRPSRVQRVHANPGEDHAIGDDTGVSYPLGENVSSPGFITGVGLWRDFCGPGGNTQLILEVNAEGTDQPRIIFVAADDPQGSSVADFTVTAVDGVVTASWRKTMAYNSLAISTRRAGEMASTVVQTFNDFANDPESLPLTDLTSGTFEVLATATTSQGELFPLVASVTLGVGGVQRAAEFAPEGSANPVAAGATILGEQLVVVDSSRGDATVYNFDLEAQDTIVGPSSDGTEVSVAYNTSDNLLYWLQDDEGRFSIQAFNLETDRAMEPILLDTPRSLPRVDLTDFSYDAEGDVFWTVDRLNQRIYPFAADGTIPEAFRIAQFEVNDVTLGGGISVAAADASTITLDLALAAGGGIARRVYQRTEFSQLAELFRIGLSSTTGTADIASVATATGEDGLQVGFVTAPDVNWLFGLDFGPAPDGGVFFRRGDANNDGEINISDVTAILSSQFTPGARQLSCDDAADIDNNEAIDLTDAVNLFEYLFRSGAAPQAPFDSCGTDEDTETLTCSEASCA